MKTEIILLGHNFSHPRLITSSIEGILTSSERFSLNRRGRLMHSKQEKIKFLYDIA